MARGSNFGNFYTSSTGISSSYTGGGLGGFGLNAPLRPMAGFILERYGIPSQNVTGSNMSGYDIKSQDATNILKLSLLAEGEGGYFPEVYCGPDGVARLVKVGQPIGVDPGLEDCFLKQTNSVHQKTIDHVLVRGKKALPRRSQKGSVDVMGAGYVYQPSVSCPPGTRSTKNEIIGREAWAVFQRSMQSEQTQDLLKAAVDKTNWETLVAYKMTFSDIPNYCSMSPSQTTPKDVSLQYGGQLNSSFVVDLGDTFDDAGGVTDISGVNAHGAPVLDLVTGTQLLSQFSSVLSNVTGYDFDDNTQYCLLSNECGIYGLSQGQNWYLLPAGENTAEVYIRGSNSSTISARAFDRPDFATLPSTVHYFRLKGSVKNISSISDMIKANIGPEENGDPFDSLGGVQHNNPFRSQIVAGLGGNFGLETSGLYLSYSVARPSIMIRSKYGNAWDVASRLAANGIGYVPVYIYDPPPKTAWANAGEVTLVTPPNPPQDEGDRYEVDSPLDELEGSVLDISAPYLSDDQSLSLASTISTLINNEPGEFASYSYRSGGYNLLPGMQFEGGIINTIEFSYQDKSVMSTNISTGPVYYPIGSYPDSQYVKRSETITRNGTIVAGSNASGQFIVNVDGLGRYEAISSIFEPIYPADKVEVRIMNVPVEKD